MVFYTCSGHNELANQFRYFKHVTASCYTVVEFIEQDIGAGLQTHKKLSSCLREFRPCPISSDFWNNRYQNNTLKQFSYLLIIEPLTYFTLWFLAAKSLSRRA